MNQWAFVIAAYVVTFAGIGVLIGWAVLSCRRAEARAEGASRQP